MGDSARSIVAQEEIELYPLTCENGHDLSIKKLPIAFLYGYSEQAKCVSCSRSIEN